MKTGRNDTCPCNSGKKYKKCCLLKDPRYNFNKKNKIFNEYAKFWLVICGICISITLYLVIETSLFIKRSLRTNAKITHIEYSGHKSKRLTFTFVDRSGVSRKVKSNYASTSVSYQLEQEINIYYDPARPYQAKIDSFTYLWEFPFIISFFAYCTFILSLNPKLLQKRILSKKESEI